jgi:cell division transport system permease protein
MSTWLVQHWLVLRFTLRRLLAAPVASLLNIAIMGIALSLPVGIYVLQQNVQGLAAQAAGTPQISVFMARNASKEEVAQTGRRLGQLDGIERIEFVPREQALEQLKHSTGLADIIGGLNQNPLPDAYILYPRHGDPSTLEALRDELQKWPKLDQVQLDSAWARKLEALLSFVRLAVLILSTLLSVALVAITFNTIRLQILTKRDEIEVSKLIGATHAFIRRPFLYFGLVQGLLAGAAAWLIIALSLYLLNDSLAHLAQLYASNFTLHHLSLGDSLSLLLFSGYLGWLGAWLSVSQHLWQIEPR